MEITNRANREEVLCTIYYFVNKNKLTKTNVEKLIGCRGLIYRIEKTKYVPTSKWWDITLKKLIWLDEHDLSLDGFNENMEEK